MFYDFFVGIDHAESRTFAELLEMYRSHGAYVERSEAGTYVSTTPSMNPIGLSVPSTIRQDLSHRASKVIAFIVRGHASD
jgi:hypothetical protein